MEFNERRTLIGEVDVVPQKERDECALEKWMGHDPQKSYGIFELQETFEACSHSFISQERGQYPER